MRKTAFVFCFICLTKFLAGQDMHFSQVYMSPLSLSPMQTGNFDGDWRFSNNYRTQWRSVAIPYNTLSAGFEKQFYIHKEHFAGGIYILNDESGHVFLNVTKIYASFAYHKAVNYNNFHLGLQVGYVHKSYDKDKATLPSQFDMSTGYFNSSLNNGELNLNDKTGYPDLNFAAGWSRRFNVLEPEIGISFFHLNFPKESFLTENNRLPIRSVFSGRLFTHIGDKWLLTPTFFAMGHRSAADFIAGTRLDYYLKPIPVFFKGVFGGFYYRVTPENADAMIVQGGLTFKNFEIGLSYDINVSGLKTATGSRGAFELGIIYTGASTILNKNTIPCERM